MEVSLPDIERNAGKSVRHTENRVSLPDIQQNDGKITRQYDSKSTRHTAE
jgi:hypothetical protein